MTQLEENDTIAALDGSGQFETEHTPLSRLDFALRWTFALLQLSMRHRSSSRVEPQVQRATVCSAAGVAGAIPLWPIPATASSHGGSGGAGGRARSIGAGRNSARRGGRTAGRGRRSAGPAPSAAPADNGCFSDDAIDATPADDGTL